YKAKMSPHLQWMEEKDIEVDSNAPTDEVGGAKADKRTLSRMNAHQAWRSYKEWVFDDNPLHRETKEEVRTNLREATGGKVRYDRFGDERVFFGMRSKNMFVGGNVVNFPIADQVGQVDTAAEDLSADGGEDAKK